MPYALIMLVMQVFRSMLGLIVYFFGSFLRGRLDPGPLALSILADEHLISGYEKYGLKRWAVVYPLLSFVLIGGLFWFGGWMSVLYLLLAQFFMTGFLHPHNFGIILSNSHFHGISGINHRPRCTVGPIGCISTSACTRNITTSWAFRGIDWGD